MNNPSKRPWLTDELSKIVEKTTEDTGYEFGDSELKEILGFTYRKCHLNQKDGDYVSILFEDELKDYLMRKTVEVVSNVNVYINSLV